jgi:3-hydroxyacyl-[acyl-carrier-protein] dehydratase
MIKEIRFFEKIGFRSDYIFWRFYNFLYNEETMTEILNIQDIMRYLPHRYPFIMIDRVIEFEKGKRIVALKNVTINEPFFQGHFPGSPVMPGVLIVEAMGQAGGVLFIRSLPPEKHGSLLYFMSLDKVRFRKPVVPGDQMIIEVIILKERSKALKLSGVVTVDGVKAAEAEFMATIGEKI